MTNRKFFKEAFKAGYKAGMKKLNEKEDDYNWLADEYSDMVSEDEKVSVYFMAVSYHLETDSKNPLLDVTEKELVKFITKNCVGSDFEVGNGYVVVVGDPDGYNYDVELEDVQNLESDKVQLQIYAYYAIWCPYYNVERDEFVKEIGTPQIDEQFKLNGFKNAEKYGLKLLAAKAYPEDADYLGEFKG